MGLLAAEFGFIDLNKNGAVSPEELHAALFIASLSDVAIPGIFQAIDKDQDGKVSQDEWIEYRSAMPTSTPEEKAWAAAVGSQIIGVDPSLKAKEVLSQYDEDKDGGLNQRELAKYIRAVNNEEVYSCITLHAYTCCVYNL